MIETEAWYHRARDEVRARHCGKTDKLGAPYHEHFERVAKRLLRLFPAEHGRRSRLLCGTMRWSPAALRRQWETDRYVRFF